MCSICRNQYPAGCPGCSEVKYDTDEDIPPEDIEAELFRMEGEPRE